MEDTVKALSKAIKDYNSKTPTDASMAAKKLHAHLTVIGPRLLEFGSSLTSLTSSIIATKAHSCEHADTNSFNIRRLDDLHDDNLQRHHEGRLVVSVNDEQLKTDLGLSNNNADYRAIDVKKLVSALNERYNVDISPHNLFKARRTSRNASIQIGFIDRKIGSAFYKLCLAIKRKGANAPGQKLYVNFKLSPRRNEIAWILRRAWKDKLCSKFFIDQDGSISYVENDSNKKVCITSVVAKDSNFVLWTITPRELKKQSKNEID